MNEVGGAVQRVNDPDEFAVLGAVLAARFFGQDAMAGVSRDQHVDDGFFSLLVHLGDEVVGLFDRDADRFDIKCRTVDDGAGGARSLDGHVEHGV